MAQFERNLAIVIGINNYQFGIPTLRTARNDAEKIAQILQEQHGYKVWGLIDQQATLANFSRLLEDFLPGHIKENDRLILYFAGHGIAVNGDDGPEGFLIPQDARLGDTSTYFPMELLQKALSKLPCRHFLTILDCCFAGAFRWSSTRKLLVVPKVIHRQHYDRFLEAAAWQVITSASHDQTAFDSLALDLQDHRGVTSDNHSPFAAALIEALQGDADSSPPAKDGKPPGDGVITATELYLYLRDRVEVAAERKGARQTPGLYPLQKHERGEYIFLTPNHDLNLPVAPPLDESQNPYRGLESFDQEHCQLFFGRQALTKELYLFSSDHPLTVVLGASGSGKSSLVKAGLIPYIHQLNQNTSDPWQVLTPMRPGESAYKALSKTLTEQQSGSSILGLNNLERSKLLSGQIRHMLQSAPNSKLLLVIDQAEELFTICSDQTEKEHFLALLAEWLEEFSQQLRIVITLRSDFESQFRSLAWKNSWQQARFLVPAMTRAELRDAIEKPAAARVMYFEPYSLVECLIDEVAQMPGALPLLSFALSELYLKYLEQFRAGHRDKRAITQADYAEIGGVTQSLTKRADWEYAKLVEQDSNCAQTIRYVMLRMIALGGGELARRRVLLSELRYPEPENTRVKKIIKRFSMARLLVEGQNSEWQPYVEPAHDALVRGWQQLLSWKQEEEDSLLLQRRLTPAAEEWKNLELKQQNSLVKTKIEPLSNWLDVQLYAIEKLFDLIKQQLRKLLRRMSEQKLLLSRPEEFLWNSNPYLSVLQDKLNSSTYWFNQIEAEFVKRSLRRKRNINRRSNFSLIVFLSLLGLAIYGASFVTKLVAENTRNQQEVKRLSKIERQSKAALDSSNAAKTVAETALSSSNLSLQNTKDALQISTKAIAELENALANSNQALEKAQATLVEERDKFEQQLKEQAEKSEPENPDVGENNPSPEPGENPATGENPDIDQQPDPVNNLGENSDSNNVDGTNSDLGAGNEPEINNELELETNPEEGGETDANADIETGVEDDLGNDGTISDETERETDIPGDQDTEADAVIDEEINPELDGVGEEAETLLETEAEIPEAEEIDNTTPENGADLEEAVLSE